MHKSYNSMKRVLKNLNFCRFYGQLMFTLEKGTRWSFFMGHQIFSVSVRHSWTIVNIFSKIHRYAKIKFLQNVNLDIDLFFSMNWNDLGWFILGFGNKFMDFHDFLLWSIFTFLYILGLKCKVIYIKKNL